MHVAVAVLAREPLTVLARLVKVTTVEDELGTELRLRREVDPAANLEGADGLVVRVRDEDRSPKRLVEASVVVEGRRAQIRRDPAPRLEHVRERWWLPLH